MWIGDPRYAADRDCGPLFSSEEPLLVTYEGTHRTRRGVVTDVVVIDPLSTSPGSRKRSVDQPDRWPGLNSWISCDVEPIQRLHSKAGGSLRRGAITWEPAIPGVGNGFGGAGAETCRRQPPGTAGCCRVLWRWPVTRSFICSPRSTSTAGTKPVWSVPRSRPGHALFTASSQERASLHEWVSSPPPSGDQGGATAETRLSGTAARVRPGCRTCPTPEPPTI